MRCDGGGVTFVCRAPTGCRRGSCLQRNRGIQQCEHVRDCDGCQSPLSSVCVCVCVCEREREREYKRRNGQRVENGEGKGQREGGRKDERVDEEGMEETETERRVVRGREGGRKERNRYMLYK